MGANDFLEIQLGKSIGEAFDKAAEQGRYEHGHGGYSGTIAEKYEVVDCGKLPPRWTLNDFIEAVRAVQREQYPEDNSRWATTPEQKKREAKFRARRKKLAERIKRDVPEVTLRKLIEVTDDKWGPAAGIEVTGVDAKKAKERLAPRGSSSCVIDARGREVPGSRKTTKPSIRGLKVYAFFGLASS